MTVLARKLSLSGPDLLAEGVLEVGAVRGTNLLYVRTKARLYLFMADQVEETMLDLSPWAVERARELYQDGYRFREVCALLRLPSRVIASGNWLTHKLSREIGASIAPRRQRSEAASP